MKVKELIEQLQKVDLEKDIVIELEDSIFLDCHNTYGDYFETHVSLTLIPYFVTKNSCLIEKNDDVAFQVTMPLRKIERKIKK